ncbi:winged helix-turn-helix transcriptional regulator [Natronosalvus vescus]|uniref:winged helix-turn-helix transcriptional regulator n=1 Tax=Natronosalvus vescus TaxID=2953881 RepID=UPI002090D89A|nr:helix-turn-helix domain-containing protein [Natronosalvus vescus]
MSNPEPITDALETLLEAPATDALAAVDAVESSLDAQSNPSKSLESASPTPDDDAATEETATDILDLLGRRHALAILRATTTGGGASRFSELEDVVSASPSTISARLSEFVEAGLLERETFDEVPPRVEYRPTEAATSLAPLFVYLRLWEDRYGAGRSD